MACYHAYMKQNHPTRTFGLIGLILIITAFVLWGFVVPAMQKSFESDNQTIDKAVEPPSQRQENPHLPTGESAMPSPQ